MFNNLKKLCTGRTNVKVLATLLVLTLTFANFALLRFIHGRGINIVCNRYQFG